MTTTAKATAATTIPCLRYRDAPAAIEWLCKALGFEKQLIVPDGNGGVAHAQLSFGNGMVMVAPAIDSDYGRLMKLPGDIGGANTQNCYLVVSDADAVYRSAREAGAEIVLDIKDEDYGGRGFTCRDPEGHIWSLGTYDPW
ncbi:MULTISPECIES: VOC family protein [unclassified Janthinobacterium]|uniref:VOC family protein n=1 Tax=unclassified Janthinobacterium TaxID=2610881 RepID=UPI00055EC9D1|nr:MULTISPECIES: VOC family protein [unclassified Janthinobacterium]NVI84857.1 VOC family protein [Janthinobacterium sp. BJB401]